MAYDSSLKHSTTKGSGFEKPTMNEIFVGTISIGLNQS